jgi:hypothetical protein
MWRIVLTLFGLLVPAAVATAGPLPWSYYVRVNAPTGFDGVLLGSSKMPATTDGGPEPEFYHLWDTQLGNYGMVRINFETPTGTETLFAFSPGFEESVLSLPAGKSFSPGTINLSWGFQGQTEIVTGDAGGTLTASDLFTTGTGNYVIGLDHSQTVTLDGRTAVVRFTGENTENGSRIDMSVTPIEQTAAPNVPEPGTMILSGTALGGFGVWWRRRRASSQPRSTEENR